MNFLKIHIPLFVQEINNENPDICFDSFIQFIALKTARMCLATKQIHIAVSPHEKQVYDGTSNF